MNKRLGKLLWDQFFFHPVPTHGALVAESSQGEEKVHSVLQIVGGLPRGRKADPLA